MKKIKIGIIGAGRIGKIHAENLLKLPEAEIAGISDLYAGPVLEAWAAERGIPFVTKDSAALSLIPESMPCLFAPLRIRTFL